MTLRVDHFGPDPSAIGGMSSVLRTLVEGSVGGDRVVCHPTWRPGPTAATALPAARAGAEIVRLPAGTVAHLHLSERGSFVREGALLRLASARDLTVVATIHGADFSRFAARRGRLVRSVLGAADGIVCLDREVLEYVRSAAPRATAELIPNPVGEADAGPIEESGETVLFAGEVGRRKGADVLAAAWPSVVARRPAARCLIVGPAGDLVPAPASRLEVRPPVGPAAIAGLLGDARVVALPSRAEGMPMFLTEAMRSARPFVATPVGGVPELAAGGVLVPVGDPDALADALVGLLADPARAKALGERGRGLFLATRSVAAVDARLRSFYAACTGGA